MFCLCYLHALVCTDFYFTVYRSAKHIFKVDRRILVEEAKRYHSDIDGVSSTKKCNSETYVLSVKFFLKISVSVSKKWYRSVSILNTWTDMFRRRGNLHSKEDNIGNRPLKSGKAAGKERWNQTQDVESIEREGIFCLTRLCQAV